MAVEEHSRRVDPPGPLGTAAPGRRAAGRPRPAEQKRDPAAGDGRSVSSRIPHRRSFEGWSPSAAGCRQNRMAPACLGLGWIRLGLRSGTVGRSVTSHSDRRCPVPFRPRKKKTRQASHVASAAAAGSGAIARCKKCSEAQK